MNWLELSVEKFEPIPDISFSIKKPLFAASIVLTYSRAVGAQTITASSIATAKIPIKGALRFVVDVESAEGPTFAFSNVSERDEVGGHAREIRANGSTLVMEKSGATAPTTKKIQNDSPVPILAHLLILPAFQQSRTDQDKIYAGHIVVGTQVQAVRLERTSATADILGRTKYDFHVETYEGKFMSVAHALGADDFGNLPWESKKAFEFDWDVARKTITAARFSIPIFGKLEIKN